jgi:5-methylcytosine-specific restriction endonuclease McrA
MSDQTIPPLKHCSKCGTSYPATLEYFRRRSANKSGLGAECVWCTRKRASDWAKVHLTKEIKSERDRKYRQAHPEKLREKRHRWYEANAGRISERSRRDYKANREQYRNRQRDYYRHHSAIISEKSRKWSKDNPERKHRYDRDWQRANPDKVRIINRKWRQANPDKIRIKQGRRRTRLIGLPNTFTNDDWARALEYFHGVCAYCQQPPNLFDVNRVLHVDHFIPLADPSCPGTIPTNMIPACQKCNLSKQHQSPIEWLTVTFGKRKAKNILKRIEDYFASLR